ncbi:MAG TPA: SUKH-4 family immunity protein [Candidatus Janibacter merdipullorum]|nr:SUKH-4 family immunity protein [Candidatus Janibacter merdipullorum]
MPDAARPRLHRQGGHRDADELEGHRDPQPLPGRRQPRWRGPDPDRRPLRDDGLPRHHRAAAQEPRGRCVHG